MDAFDTLIFHHSQHLKDSFYCNFPFFDSCRRRKLPKYLLGGWRSRQGRQRGGTMMEHDGHKPWDLPLLLSMMSMLICVYVLLVTMVWAWWMWLLFWCVIVVESCIFRKGMMCMNRCRCSSSSLYRLFDPRLQSVGAISYVSYEYSPAVLKTSWDLTLCTCVYTRNID